MSDPWAKALISSLEAKSTKARRGTLTCPPLPVDLLSTQPPSKRKTTSCAVIVKNIPAKSETTDEKPKKRVSKQSQDAPAVKKVRVTKAMMFHNPIPDYLVHDAVDTQARKKLGISALTYRPLPRTENDPEGKTPCLTSLDRAKELRTKIWSELGSFIIISMDPAINYFAVRIERRSRDGQKAETLYFKVHDFDPGSLARSKDKSLSTAERRTTGQSSVEGELLTHARMQAEFFSEPVRGWIQGAHVVLVEHQHSWHNPKVTEISSFGVGLIASLLALQPVFTAPIVIETHSKLKNFAIVMPDGRKANEHTKVVSKKLKDSSETTAADLLLKWQDTEGHRILTTQEGKRADLADTVMHISAWMAMVGWHR